MDAAILSGSSNRSLGEKVAGELGTDLTPCRVGRFPDGEFEISVESRLRGRDIYLIQSTGPPIHSNLVELLMLADACYRVGASRITAIVPYLGYARQDRRSNPGTPVGLRVLADALSNSHIERLLVVDPHTSALEAVFAIPVERSTAVPALASRLASELPDDPVIVAPDLGAVKLAERYASHLRRPVAVVRKMRISGARVEALGVVGDVAGRSALIVDDMITTGATIEATARLLLNAGCQPDLVVATHAVLCHGAVDRLRKLPIRNVLVTDSLSGDWDLSFVTVCSIAPLLAEAILRLNLDRSLEDLELFA